MPDIRSAHHTYQGAWSLKLLARAVICIAMVAAFTASGAGSIMVGEIIESSSGRVFINVFGNHGVPLGDVIPALHEAEALDVIRLKLLNEKRINDLPVLVVVPSGIFGGPHPIRISHESECTATYGETGPSRYHLPKWPPISAGFSELSRTLD